MWATEVSKEVLLKATGRRKEQYKKTISRFLIQAFVPSLHLFIISPLLKPRVSYFYPPPRAGGHRVRLSLSNCRRFSQLALRHRAAECAPALAAVRRGLGAVLPLPVLRLMSPAAVEEAVCGAPTVSVQELRRVARHR